MGAGGGKHPHGVAAGGLLTFLTGGRSGAGPKIEPRLKKAHLTCTRRAARPGINTTLFRQGILRGRRRGRELGPGRWPGRRHRGRRIPGFFTPHFPHLSAPGGQNGFAAARCGSPGTIAGNDSHFARGKNRSPEAPALGVGLARGESSDCQRPADASPAAAKNKRAVTGPSGQGRAVVSKARAGCSPRGAGPASRRPAIGPSGRCLAGAFEGGG